MTHFGAGIDLPCPPERVQSLLIDPGFLDAFVRLQEPESQQINIDEEQWTGIAHWTMVLPADVPWIVKQVVGPELGLTLTVDIGDPGTLTLDAKGKQFGRAQSSLVVTPRSDGSRLRVDGTLEVRAGMLSNQAAKLVRDQVVKPVLEEEPFPLLPSWCAS